MYVYMVIVMDAPFILLYFENVDKIWSFIKMATVINWYSVSLQWIYSSMADVVHVILVILIAILLFFGC